MLFSQAKGHKVVSTATAETVGLVDAVVLDPSTSRVAALHLRKTSGDGDVLPWASLTAFGADAVTVSGSDVIVTATGDLVTLADKSHAVLGKRVLTTAGTELGHVDDIDFDPADGRLVSLVLAKGAGAVDGPLLRSVGSYAVVVATGPDDPTVVPRPLDATAAVST